MSPKVQSLKARQINQEGLDLIKKFEGLCLTSYQDIGGVWTIGYGHTGPEIKENQQITYDQAEALLKLDLAKFEAGVSAMLTKPLSDNQYSACVSLAYNIGLENFKQSSLIKILNTFTFSPQSKFREAAEQFPLWCKVHGKVVPGLLARRNAEKFLFLKG